MSRPMTLAEAVAWNALVQFERDELFRNALDPELRRLILKLRAGMRRHPPTKKGTK